MLKVYIIISIIITLLMVVTEIKAKLNKNVSAYLKKVLVGDKKWYQRLLSWIKCLIYCWLPIINLYFMIAYLYLMFASDYTLIKMAKDLKVKEDKKKKEIERLLNEEL